MNYESTVFFPTFQRWILNPLRLRRRRLVLLPLPTTPLIPQQTASWCSPPRRCPRGLLGKYTCTPFPIPSFTIFRQMFWVFSDRLVGRLCSYLLPERVLLDARNFKTLSRKITVNDGMNSNRHHASFDHVYLDSRVLITVLCSSLDGVSVPTAVDLSVNIHLAEFAKIISIIISYLTELS